MKFYEAIEFEPTTEEIETEHALKAALAEYGDDAFFYTQHPRKSPAYTLVVLLVRFKQGGPIYQEVFRTTYKEFYLDKMARLATTKNFRESLKTFLFLKRNEDIMHKSKRLTDLGNAPVRDGGEIDADIFVRK